MKKRKSKKMTITLKLDLETLEYLKRLSKLSGKSLGSVISIILAIYIVSSPADSGSGSPKAV